MEIQTNTATQFTARAETVKQDLNAKPVNTNVQNVEKTELERPSLIQAVKPTDESANEKALNESSQSLEVVANDLADMVALMQKGLKFSVDEDSGKQVIKVQDIESGDIIRQIPSEEALKLAEKLSEVSGILMKIEV
ncbi:flagellar protein FlaG [Shewanella gaetbuli]|uniref:Flagellar protein FlaG n=1 Tax=Shewanella gaetbuli TaxID=220752 RepID=A0A9X1ZT64_9GAMM|nr:flagellar protein FlaG [Shewanella gaetbuli]MCL1141696.1 flagellar protein FlaG [Shewanella gaetbuli]